MTITVVGSGNIAHALVAYMGEEHEIYVLTSSKQKWQCIEVMHKNIKGCVKKITTDPQESISKSDLILFTLPSFAREKKIQEIAPFIKENTLIGSFPGVAGFNEEIAKYIDLKNINVFASQRVPFISRIEQKGKSVAATKKDSIDVAILKDKDKTLRLLENVLEITINVLDDFMEVNLSNSNPILHTARLYTLVSNKDRLKENLYFYKNWDDESSKVLLDMDSEFMQIVQKLNLKNVKSLKAHYEVDGVSSMTKKLSSIKVFENIKSPFILDRLELDTNSRYFQEDVLKSLKYIKDRAKKINISIPVIEMVYHRLVQEIHSES